VQLFLQRDVLRLGEFTFRPVAGRESEECVISIRRRRSGIPHHFFTRRLPVEITEVRITLRNEQKLKAFASITFDNAFVVRGLKVINGSQGYFVSMPSRRKKDGMFQDLAHPICNDLRKKIEDRVLDAFEHELNLRNGSPAPGAAVSFEPVLEAEPGNRR
jgi:stage V sporulation protein G